MEDDAVDYAWSVFDRLEGRVCDLKNGVEEGGTVAVGAGCVFVASNVEVSEGLKREGGESNEGGNREERQAYRNPGGLKAFCSSVKLLRLVIRNVFSNWG